MPKLNITPDVALNIVNETARANRTKKKGTRIRTSKPTKPMSWHEVKWERKVCRELNRKESGEVAFANCMWDRNRHSINVQHDSKITLQKCFMTYHATFFYIKSERSAKIFLFQSKRYQWPWRVKNYSKIFLCRKLIYVVYYFVLCHEKHANGHQRWKKCENIHVCQLMCAQLCEQLYVRYTIALSV